MTALPQDVVAELKDRIAELEQRLQAGAADNGRLARELASSRERQKASAEILATIAGTTGEAEQALQQIAETTARLFGASSVSIQLAENGEWGKAYRYGASAQRIRAAVPLADLKVGGRNLPGAVVGRNQQIDVPDLDHPAPDVADFPGLPHARAAGTRTMCGTPLRSKGTAIGSLIVHRDRLEPFSDEELALLQSFADQAAIAIENARLFNETRDALERQTATAEVLQIISRSAFDLSSVLQTLIEVAAKLCRADQAQIYRRQGEVYRSAATCGNMREAYRAIEQRGVISPGPDTLVGRVALEARPVQIADAWNDPHYGPKDDARLGNLHSMLGVPLLRDGELVGAFALARDHVEPFADREIELVRTFADQAVIAIENTRLFNETKDALARQTATADILRVISRSPTDVQPVFDAIVQTVVRLVGCETAFIQRCDGKYFWSVARCTREEGLMTVINPRHAPIDPSANFPSRAIVGRTTLHLSDWSRIELPEFERRIQEQLGYQSAVYLPLLRDGECIGVLGLAGSRPGMFGETEIALAEAFRDQALIAIENTRLFKETQEALERQTATSEILKVIASSPSDVQPVFDAIATSSKRLIGGFSTAVFRFVDGIAHLAAFTPTSPEADEVLKAGFPSPVERFEPFALAQGGKPIQVADIATLPDTGIKEIARARGFRSMLFAPLMSSGVPIGLISVTRIEAGSFIDHHVQLLQTFADQAVIAIENAHLFEQVEAKTRELTESLQQQTATADVLKAISRSAFDLQTVLDALLTSACRLCEADIGTIRYEAEGSYRLAATYGCKPEWIKHFQTYTTKADRSSIFGRTILERRPTHVPDVLADPDYSRPQAQKLMGFRAALGVPLVREGHAFGVINLFRCAAGSFADKQIELVTTFADQAVIAIENVRLFEQVQARTRELTEALTYQTGSANILKVIASSPTDVEPVLRTIVESACELCEAYDAVVILKNGGDLVVRAHHGPIELGAKSWTDDRTSVSGRAIADRAPIHLHDVLSDEGTEFPIGQELSRRDGCRTMLAVPMLSEGESIGAIVLRRAEVQPFGDKQVTLLKTFADQAVIAIGNVRLFEQVQARTRELTEALTYQTGSANILKVIASSPTEAGPALQAIVESACELCEAYDAAVVLKDGDFLRFSAHHGPIPIGLEKWPINRRWTAGRAFIDQTPVHIEDLSDEKHADFSDGRELAIRMGHRSILSVPLLREGESIGAIVLRRKEVHPFTEKQIALLQTFADQAVIAIGNVRLFEEVQAKTRDLTESLQQQTATADVLKVISRSAFDLQTVLETLIRSAVELSGARRGVIFLRDGEQFNYRAASYADLHPDWVQFLKTNPQKAGRHSAVARAIESGRVVCIPDILADPEITMPATVLAGIRAVLAVPLLRDGRVEGIMALSRQVPGPFTERQIDLVQTFADQAVIALENVRLFEQVQARTRELAKSLDELRAAQDRLVQTEKLASLGQLTAGIAHEIKNPLNFVNNFAALSAELTDELNELLDSARLAEDVRGEVAELTGLLKGNLEKVVQHGKRADSIVRNMLLHSREGSGERRPADVNAIVEESLNLAYHGARAERAGFNVTLTRDLDPNAGTAELYPQEITRVLLNLISNGFYAVAKRMESAGGGFEPTLSAATRVVDGDIEIRIRDNGGGIPDDVLARIFNPFFTTKPAGEGTGLGLSMSHDIIVKQHGGRIDVETEPGVFTEFIITLPRRHRVRPVS